MYIIGIKHMEPTQGLLALPPTFSQVAVNRKKFKNLINMRPNF